VIFGAEDQPRGFLYAVGRQDGRPLWKRPFGGGIATQVFRHQDKVLAVGLGGDVRAVDLTSGNVVWEAKGPEGVHGTYCGDPTLYEGRLLVAWRPGWIDSFDANTGELIWRTQVRAILNTGVAVSNQELVVGTAEGQILRLDPGTGSILGTFEPTEPPGLFYGDLVPSDRCLLALHATGANDDVTALSGPFSLLCLRPKKSEIVWQLRSEAAWSSLRPLLWEDSVSVGRTGEVLTVGLPHGRQRESMEVRGTPRGMGASDRFLFVGTREGQVLAFRRPTGERRAGQESAPPR